MPEPAPDESDEAEPTPTPTPTPSPTPYIPGGDSHDDPPLPSNRGGTVVPGPTEDIWYELDDDGVPYAQWVWYADDEVWVLEDYVPYAGFAFDDGEDEFTEIGDDLPFTGYASDDGRTMLWYSLLGLLAMLGITYMVKSMLVAGGKDDPSA